MTASEADNPTTRRELAARALDLHRLQVGDGVVKAFLRGHRARPGTQSVLLMEAAALGIDVSTIPAPTAEERAAWVERRRGRRACPECARLRARVAELEARLATACCYPTGSVEAIDAQDARARETVTPARPRQELRPVVTIDTLSVPPGECA